MNSTRTRAATIGLLGPAALALGVSADTSVRYMSTRLGIENPWERGLLCGVAESAIVALTIYAWATRTKGPAYLAYAAVLVQSIPAFSVSGGSGGLFRVVVGPVLLAVMLHLLLGLELRMSGGKSDGILAAALREIRERVTASLGIGRRGVDSAAIARSRSADRAVDLADRVAAVSTGSRRYTRRSAKLAAAIDGARHGLSVTEADAAEAAIVSRVVRRKSVGTLATIEARHDWTATLPTTDRDSNRDTATSPVATDRDTDRDTATATATPAATTDRDTATSPVATDHDSDSDTEAAPSTATPVPAARVVNLASKRQTATTRAAAPGLPLDLAPVAHDTAATATLPAPAPATDAAPSVAQIVREAMQAGMTDRDAIVSRVQQYRPGTPRATVARAMQRQDNKTHHADTGHYL